jgi:predicted ester cyclase
MTESAALERPVDQPPYEEMCRLVTKLAEVKSRQDVQAALDIYHPDGVLEAPPFNSRQEGEEQLRAGLDGFFKFAPDYSVDLNGLAADGDTLCGWGTVRMTPSFSFNGATPNGKRVETPVFILFRFRDRRVIWESFNFDMADVARQVGLTPDAFVLA